MPYFKDTNGGLHYLSDADIVNGGKSLIPAECIAITDTQADEILTPPPMTLSQVTASLIAQAQSYIDSKAVAKDYDSASSCISYMGSTNLTWKEEANLMLAWRDAVWSVCYANAANVTATTTWEQLLLLLPAAPW